jgi:excisionase family DNA binding protein
VRLGFKINVSEAISDHMKILFDPEEIKEIAREVSEHLKPLLAADREANEATDEILTIEEAAALLHTSKGQIYQWVNNAQHGLGDFPYLKAGRLLRFSTAEIRRWLERTGRPLEKRKK